MSAPIASTILSMVRQTTELWPRAQNQLCPWFPSGLPTLLAWVDRG